MKKLLSLILTLLPVLAFGQAQGVAVRALNGASTNQILVGTVRVPEGAAVGKVLMGTNANGALTWSSDTLTNIVFLSLASRSFSIDTTLPDWFGRYKGLGLATLSDRIKSATNFVFYSALADTNTIDHTLRNYISNSVPNTCLVLSNGIYNIGTNELIASRRLMILGQSFSNTVLYASSNGAGILMREGFTAGNLAAIPMARSNWYSSPFYTSDAYADNTNIYIINVNLLTDTDSARFSPNSNRVDAVMMNVRAITKWDGPLFEGTNTSSHLWLHNCWFTSDDSTLSTGFDGNVRTLRFNSGTLMAQHCKFEATGTGQIEADATIFSTGGGLQSATLEDCILTASNPGGDAWEMINGTAVSVSIQGGNYRTALMSGNKTITKTAQSFAGDFTGLITTGTATNAAGSRVAYLSDTNGLGGGGPSTLDLQWRTNATLGGITNVNATDVSVHIRSNTITAGAITNTGGINTGFRAINTSGAQYYMKSGDSGFGINSGLFLGQEGSGVLPGFGTVGNNSGAWSAIGASPGNSAVAILLLSNRTHLGVSKVLKVDTTAGQDALTVNTNGSVTLAFNIVVTNGYSSRNFAGTNYFTLAATNSGIVGDVLTVTGIENNTNIHTKMATPAAGGAGTFNANQFDNNASGTNIKSGAVVTNFTVRPLTTAAVPFTVQFYNGQATNLLQTENLTSGGGIAFPIIDSGGQLRNGAGSQLANVYATNFLTVLANGVKTEIYSNYLATGTLVAGTNNIHSTNQFQVAVPTMQEAFSVDTNGKVTIPVLAGTTSNDNAPSGTYGEFVSSYVAVGSPVALTTATEANVTSISLTAGDWDVEGNVNIAGATATYTQGQAAISTTTATLSTDGSEVYSGAGFTLLSVTDGITLPRKRISIAATTTVYLVAKATFSAGTMGSYGGITARRVR